VIESRSALCGDRGDPNAQIYQRKRGTDGVNLGRHGRHARDVRRPTMSCWRRVSALSQRNR
jgi:hypothetical protein